MPDMLVRLGRRWRAFTRLTWAERRFLVEAALLLPAVALALRLAGFQRVQATMSRTRGAQRAALDGRTPSAATIAYLVAVASRYTLGRPRCLPQALVLWSVLRRQGRAAELRIGVRKQDDQIEAHAWVEYDGAVFDVAGGGYKRFSPFEGAPVAGQRGVS